MNSPQPLLSKEQIQDQALSLLEELDNSEKTKVLEYLQSLVDNPNE